MAACYTCWSLSSLIKASSSLAAAAAAAGKVGTGRWRRTAHLLRWEAHSSSAAVWRLTDWLTRCVLSVLHVTAHWQQQQHQHVSSLISYCHCELPLWLARAYLATSSKLTAESSLFAVWCSGNALVSINAVALHRARLVLGWVTAFGQVNCLIT